MFNVGVMSIVYRLDPLRRYVMREGDFSTFRPRADLAEKLKVANPDQGRA